MGNPEFVRMRIRYVPRKRRVRSSVFISQNFVAASLLSPRAHFEPGFEEYRTGLKWVVTILTCHFLSTLCGRKIVEWFDQVVRVKVCLQTVRFSLPSAMVCLVNMDHSAAPVSTLASPAVNLVNLALNYGLSAGQYGSRARKMERCPAPAATQHSGSCDTASGTFSSRGETHQSASSKPVGPKHPDDGASGRLALQGPVVPCSIQALPAEPRSPILSTHTESSKTASSNPCVPISQRFQTEHAAAASRSPCSERNEESSAFIRQYLYTKLPPVTSETDFDRLTRSMEAVMDNCIFYPDLDSVSAKTLLQDKDEGVFLVRNSSDPKFIFALSVKTERGATSVRVQYQRGFFQLDCEDRMKRRLPRFESVMDLVDFHVSQCRDGTGEQCRWLETSGRKDMVVKLTRPLRHSPPSLLHLSRLTVNQQLKELHLPSCSTDRLPLPDKMRNYLREYPYKI